MATPKRIKLRPGMSINSLTLLEECEERSACNHILWFCSCVCGGTITVRGTALRTGKAKSCGCLSLKALEARTTHGNSSHPLYNTCNLMADRCTNPNSDSYNYYGGRGISVCARWLSFDNFVEDVSPKPKGKQLDRCDNNGNYGPTNYRWATPKENCNNRRDNRIIKFKGEERTVSQWAQEKGMKLSTLLYRLDCGWAVERALNTLVYTKRRD